jgi:UDP-glucuronate decarboxylase
METASDVAGPLNLGNPVEYTIREVAEMTIALTGSSSRIVHRPLPTDDPKQRRPDISKAQELLGWQPKLPLRQGLTRVIEYFESLLRLPMVAGASAALPPAATGWVAPAPRPRETAPGEIAAQVR